MREFILEKQINKKDLVETLQNFITKSNLAEFQSRLDLLHAFHCHATHLETTRESEELVNVLWNLYCYFEQYSSIILTKIRDHRSPIEKKLKDYVKIVKWKDISYWSVKATMDKSHKTLHKFMKEFQVNFVDSLFFRHTIFVIPGSSSAACIFLFNKYYQQK